jgi:hypothetical protein
MQVRDYLLDVRHLVHFKDREHPDLVSSNGEPGRDELRTVSLPERNPLCLGSYLMTLPKDTTFQVSAGGYYQLRNKKLDLDAFVSYGEQVEPDIVDSYQVLKPGCQSHLDALQAGAAPSENADTQIRYIRTMNPPPNVKCPKTRRFLGILATRRLTHDAAITFDVFVRSPEDQRSLPAKRWQQVTDYLSSLQQQTLNSCEQPGTGNDPGGTRPIPLRSPPNGRSSSALLVESKSDRRCII